MNIIPVIRDLLLRNQKAVIPGFGTFVIIQKPARLNKVTQVLTPPAMVVNFDKGQQANDGILAGALSVKLKLRNQDALEAIDHFVKDAADKISDNGSVLMEGLGTLTQERTGDYAFTADADLLKRISMFDLPKMNVPSKPDPVTPPIPPPAIKQPVKTPVPAASGKAPVPFSPVKTPMVVEKRKRKWWIPVSVLLLVIAAAAGLYFSGIYKDISGLFAEKKTGIITVTNEDEKLVFGIPHNADSISAVNDSSLEAISREIDARTARENALGMQEEKDVTSEPAEVPVTQMPSSSVTGTGNPYHIIAGAFLVPNNAERQVEQLSKKGLSAVILPKKGDYYMVSLGSYASNGEAVSAMNQMKDKTSNQLWILKR